GGTRRRLGERKRLVRRTRLQHGIPGLFEQLPHEQSERIGVFDEQDGLRPAWRRRILDASFRLDLRLYTRQVDLERGALAGLAVDVHGAAALTDDPVHGGQAQAGPLALLLGREERIESESHCSGVHTMSLV